MATDFQDQEALRRLYAFASTLNRMVGSDVAKGGVVAAVVMLTQPGPALI